MVQFAIGDYVLYADIWSHRRSKLRVKWCGPALVVDTASNWVFTIENILTRETREVHANSDLGITEDLLADVARDTSLKSFARRATTMSRSNTSSWSSGVAWARSKIHGNLYRTCSKMQQQWSRIK
ncbi:Hypothetical protein PHPALM_108 [Phytophthora palmivora]|uniref:Uncharacterized protein n=1 Tax=Phytophthora palmivora TaxID=4796 RepID=A0A2P4YVP7_9STRA|nr:Hypothetical protein PHPALM_108 [Phytophthora palmivora]